VTRDVTAGACSNPCGPLLLASGRFFDKWLLAWARLGPFSIRACLAIRSATDGSRRLSRRRSPNRAAWRFPDWTAVGFRCDSTALLRLNLPDPLLGSAWLLRPLLADRGLAGVRCLADRRLSLQPTSAPLAATLTRLASELLSLISFGWPDRWPPVPAVPAFACFARPSYAWNRTLVSEPFPFSPDAFTSNDGRQFTRHFANLAEKSTCPQRLIHHPPQLQPQAILARCTTRWRSWHGASRSQIKQNADAFAAVNSPNRFC
jgi:hypothetical protein